MAKLVLDRVSKQYDGKNFVVENFNLEIDRKEFVIFVGPSGCGKSTVLRMIAGLEEITTGGIYIDERPVSGKMAARGDIAMVFQNYALYPHMSVYDNIAYVIRTLGISSSDIRTRVTGALKVVGLLDKAKAKPTELSGGEQQRVSIARALVNGPPLLIADEPTGNLDPKNSLEVMQILEQINQRGITVIVSTHDYTLVDRFRKRVLTLEKGEIVRDIQAGTYGQ